MLGVRTGAGDSLPKFNLADRCRRSRNQELSDLLGSSPAKFLTMLPVSRGSVREKRPAPLIATWLFGTYHSSYAIAVYIAACAVLSLIATALMTDYTGKDIAGEYATRAASRPTSGSTEFGISSRRGR